ncbi:MAG: hypothetical protein ACYS9X_32230 [Planctomycetota bacterium]
MSYDEAGHRRIRAVLMSDLRGMPFGEFEERLGIKNAPRDSNYTNELRHSRRTYHLGGFCLDVQVEHKDGALFTDSHFFPGLHIDGLNRERRLAKQKEALAAHFAERAGRLEETRRKAREKE